mmetsp:Transcript_29398/g.94231  ORF Transcript_29398/g.94231 Transcript_29398/m.94231 type:complete len:203 (+) Transcript_29398:170-778(+)
MAGCQLLLRPHPPRRAAHTKQSVAAAAQHGGPAAAWSNTPSSQMPGSCWRRCGFCCRRPPPRAADHAASASSEPRSSQRTGLTMPRCRSSAVTEAVRQRRKPSGSDRKGETPETKKGKRVPSNGRQTRASKTGLQGKARWRTAGKPCFTEASPKSSGTASSCEVRIMARTINHQTKFTSHRVGAKLTAVLPKPDTHRGTRVT